MTQHANLTRCVSNIGDLVLRFHRQRLKDGEMQFHAGDLRDFIAEETLTAPASADRVLRHLRKIGLVNYKVINRKMSLYEFIVNA